MNWNDAMAWVDDFVYAGFDDWRLPYSPATTSGWIDEGELGHLYYTTLGNPSTEPHGNIVENLNIGPFVNVPSTAVFWLNSMPLHPGSAWGFEFYRGMQNASADINPWYVWPVRNGDVEDDGNHGNGNNGNHGNGNNGNHHGNGNHVPDPGSTLTILGIALGGLSLMRRR